MKNLYAKLLEAQKKIGAIKKEQTNPYFKSKYADINDVIGAVKPVMNEVGLVVIQHVTELNGKIALTTIIADAESGESTESVCPLIENPDPQKMGAIITYYRRYVLQSMLFLQAEDSDGNDTKPEVHYEPLSNTNKEMDRVVFGNSIAQQTNTEEIDYVARLSNLRKTVGDKCSDCGVGEYVRSPKSGKVFCNKKCWVQKGQVTPPPTDQDVSYGDRYGESPF